MAKVKTTTSNKGQKVTFYDSGKKKAVKFGSMNKDARRSYKKYRGQGRV